MINLNILFCLLAFHCKCCSQKNHTAIYYKFDRNGVQLEEKIRLLRNNGNFSFCFIPKNKAVFKDTLVGTKKINFASNVTNHQCGYKYGEYQFFKRGKSIYIQYFNREANKKIIHKQYSLVTNDTTGYSYLFSGPYFDYLTIDGEAIYQKDTVINTYLGKSFNCHIILEYQSKSIDVKSCHKRKIFLNKETLIPVRYEFLLADGKLDYYYLIDNLNPNSP